MIIKTCGCGAQYGYDTDNNQVAHVVPECSMFVMRHPISLDDAPRMEIDGVPLDVCRLERIQAT